MARKEEQVRADLTLKRQLGLMSGIAMIVGNMIGSGIFISPVGVLVGTGSVGLSLVVWAACGFIAMLGALCYGELGTLIQKSGGEYAYILEAFGSIPAFLYAWTCVFVMKTSSLAIMCLAFSEYVLDPAFQQCAPPQSSIKLLAAATLIAITAINCYSVKLAAQVQVVFTLVKLGALTIIVIGGFVKMGQGHTTYLSSGFEGSEQSLSIVALAFYNGLWAYDGWNNLNYVTEELIKPSKNLPRSIILGIPVVTVFYILTNVSYLTVMSRDQIIQSPAVASTWARSVLGSARLIIPICVACSTFGAAHSSCFSQSRLVFTAAREGHLPQFLSYVHVTQRTPLPSLVFTCLVSLLMIIPGNISSLIEVFSFTSWVFYGATFSALIAMRYTKKDAHRPYKVPIFIPVFSVLVSLYLVIAPIAKDPQVHFLYAAMFVLAGLVFYIPFVHLKIRLKVVDDFSKWLQVLLRCAPSHYKPVD